MPGAPPDNAVFDFENILPQLDFLPIAARRALDHSGLRLSLEGWRSLSLDDRCQLVAAGASDIVDSSAVSGVTRRAAPPAQRIEVVGDPDALAPPDGLARLLDPLPLDARQWARLRALDRYALAHVHRRAIARNDPSLIQAAYEDIVAAGRLRSVLPPPGEAGGSTRPPPRLVPLPPQLPRGEAGRVPRATEARHSHEPTLPGTGPGGGQGAPIAVTPPRMAAVRNTPRTRAAASPSRPPPSRPPPSRRSPLPVDRFPEPDPSLAMSPTPSFVQRSQKVTPAAPPPDFSVLGNIEHTPSPVGARVPDLSLDGPSPQLSNHLNEAGEARMVDVGDKPVTERRAVASAIVHMRRETFRRLAQHDTPKGDVLAAARIAGIQGAKRTSELIPLCHMVALTRVDVQLDLDDTNSSVRVTASAEARDRTGVEMEALVAASIASLTIYDMLKGLDRDILISDVKLLEKQGGRAGHYQRRDT